MARPTPAGRGVAMDEPKPKFFKTGPAFRRWLATHRDSAKELWVGFYKKASGKPQHQLARVRR
jgi:hypothetical protein